MFKAVERFFRGDQLVKPLTERERRHAYLSSLDIPTVNSVSAFILFSQGFLPIYMYGVKTAVTAVGSSTLPPDQRHGPVKDIDLRILNSAPTNTPEREKAVTTIRDEIRRFLEAKHVEFSESDSTTRTLWRPGFIGDKKGIVEWVDWYNSDPSFVTHPLEGTPLHISISGVDNFEMDTYLQRERDNKTSTVVLVGS